MPNWCRNILEISGPTHDLDSFKRAAVGFSPWHEPKPEEKPNVLNFHSLMPIPESTLQAGYSSAGYNWEVENWGCKWGAFRAWIQSEYPDRICYMFETPWSPPLKLLGHASLNWLALTFGISYMDEVLNFKGEAIVRAGKVDNHFMEAEFEECRGEDEKQC